MIKNQSERLTDISVSSFHETMKKMMIVRHLSEGSNDNNYVKYKVRAFYPIPPPISLGKKEKKIQIHTYPQQKLDVSMLCMYVMCVQKQGGLRICPYVCSF